MTGIAWHDLEVLTRTLYGEARGEPKEGKIAVAHVIINRWRSKKWFAGRTLAGTCQKPWQFSCWNENDPNRAKIEAAPLKDMLDCLYAASAAVSGHALDPTGGSTHYHADYVRPKWAEGQTPAVTIGRHKFYRDIP